MKQGYAAELEKRQSELESTKLKLETLYMSRDSEADIKNDPAKLGDYNGQISAVTDLCNGLSSTLKTVKMAVETSPNLFLMPVIVN